MNNRTRATNEELSEAKEKYLGKHCYEKYRMVRAKNGKIIDQGRGLSGIVTNIVRHSHFGNILAEFKGDYVEIEHVEIGDAPKMKRHNLLEMAKYIATIPQEKFDMKFYRLGNKAKTTKDCQSIGCVIGHCTILSREPLPIKEDGSYIKFSEFSEQFTGFMKEEPEWEWCFDALWYLVDNTPYGAAQRIIYLLENGLPKDWRRQKINIAPLSYTNIKVEDYE